MNWTELSAETFISTLITCAVSVSSVCLTYHFGAKQTKHNRKYEQLKHRYETFYVPFFTILYASHMWELPISDTTLEHRKKIWCLLSENIALLDTRTLNHYPAFYDAFIAKMARDNNDPDCITGSQELNDAFNAIIDASMAEANKLSKQLHLPSITRPFSKLRRQARRAKGIPNRRGWYTSLHHH